MVNKYHDKIFCFSPPIMLATLIFEFSAAVYTVVRYKMNAVSRLVTSILITLGLFQLSEYMICGGLGLSHAQWAKFGYVTTALLPAFGIHLILAISEQKNIKLLASFYGTAAVFILYYLFDTSALSGPECYANYAVFYSHGLMSQLFSLYYFCGLLINFFLARRFSIGLPTKRRALRSIMVGGAIFVIPTYFFNVIDPTTVQAIPSIMCGFAVVFAIILVTVVLPCSGEKKIINVHKLK